MASVAGSEQAGSIGSWSSASSVVHRVPSLTFSDAGSCVSPSVESVGSPDWSAQAQWNGATEVESPVPQQQAVPMQSTEETKKSAPFASLFGANAGAAFLRIATVPSALPLLSPMSGRMAGTDGGFFESKQVEPNHVADALASLTNSSWTAPSIALTQDTSNQGQHHHHVAPAEWDASPFGELSHNTLFESDPFSMIAQDMLTF